MIVFAMIGYFLNKYGYSLGALVLGLILGPDRGKGFRTGDPHGRWFRVDLLHTAYQYRVDHPYVDPARLELADCTEG